MYKHGFYSFKPMSIVNCMQNLGVYKEIPPLSFLIYIFIYMHFCINKITKTLDTRA